MTGERVDVLRLGYRLGRDPRITTHLALVGRALGADRFLLAGDEDPKMFENLESVASRFGGGMDCEHIKSPMGWLRRFVEEDAGDGAPGVAVHLTMYGEPFREAIPRMRRDRPMVIVVGGAKVPGDVFKHCQYNIAVGNQPHSEVAALGVFLESLIGQIDESKHFQGGEIQVIPSLDRKKVMSPEEE